MNRKPRPSPRSDRDGRNGGFDNDEDDTEHLDTTLRESAMEYSQPQMFTLTSSGGQFVSSGRPEILVDVPAHAVSRTLNMTMQV